MAGWHYRSNAVIKELEGLNTEENDNRFIYIIQHHLYFELVRFLYQHSADKFIHNIRYTFVFPDFVPILKKIKRFDHRVLQQAYYLIAEYYRFLVCPINTRNLFPKGFDGVSYFIDAWTAYFFQEVGLLAEDKEIAEAIVTAVAFENTERGYKAEDKLIELLKRRYSIMTSNADVRNQ